MSCRVVSCYAVVCCCVLRCVVSIWCRARGLRIRVKVNIMIHGQRPLKGDGGCCIHPCLYIKYIVLYVL